MKYNVSHANEWKSVKRYDFINQIDMKPVVSGAYSSKGTKQYGFYFVTKVGSTEFKQPVVMQVLQ